MAKTVPATTSASRPPSALGRSTRGRLSPSMTAQAPLATPQARATSINAALGHRPPSAQSAYRPASTLDQTSAATHSSVPASGPAIGKRKGTAPVSILDHFNLPSPELRRDLFASELAGRLGLQESMCSDPADADARSTHVQSKRDISLSQAFRNLRISVDNSPPSEADALRFATPSLIPKPCTPRPFVSPIPFRVSKVVKRSAPPKKVPFLTRDSHTKAWDTKGRLEDTESLYSELKEKMNGTIQERNGLEESVDFYRSRSRLSLSSSDYTQTTPRRNDIGRLGKILLRRDSSQLTSDT